MRRFELIAPCHFGMESVLKERSQIWDMILQKWRMVVSPFRR